MSIDYNHLRRTIAEMEQGVNATTKYSWLDLAHEVLRIRQELIYMNNTWHLMLTDPERTPTEQNLATHVLDHIDQALGETNE